MYIEPVIRSVMKNLVHQSIGSLPSHTPLYRMTLQLEGLSPSEMQLVEKMSEVGQQNFKIQTGGTAKYVDQFVCNPKLLVNKRFEHFFECDQGL